MADVASGHGGDGGNQPPHGGSDRLPTDCESSNPKRRGRATNAKMFKKFEANKNQPLPLEVKRDGRQSTIIGQQRSDFIRFMSNYIVSSAPMQHPSWAEVPNNYKRNMYPSLYHYFDLQSLEREDDWPMIQASIDKECKRAYRDRKNEMKNHYNSVGGDRSRPHHAVDLARWQELCDFFSDPKHIAQSARNAENRSKHLYPSLHGSQSYTQRQWKLQQENTESSYIDNFQDMHMRGDTWVNETAKIDYHRLLEESNRMSQNLGDDEQVNQNQVFENVFGHRRGYIKGVGPTTRNAPLLPSSQIQAGPSQAQWEQQFEAYQQQQQQNIQEQMQEYRRQLEQQQQQQMEEFRRQQEQQQQQNIRQQMEEYQKQQNDFQRQMMDEMRRYQRGNHDDSSDDE